MKDQIEEILTRGVAEVIDRKDFENRLRSGKKLRLKLGIDPTSQNIHIGRAISLWKLRAMQELGHKVIIIVGDFTGLIGDTSDKDSERPMLTKQTVAKNMKGYIRQIGKILDLKKTEVHYNSEWLSKLKFLEIAEQADLFSLHEFTARELVAKRISEEKRVSIRELLYPLMQGYDSVAIKADLEIGGTDQKFNLLAGRTMQKHYGQTPQNIMTFSLLEGTDGRKMSSSWGNVINITDSPSDIYGKTMSILDDLIVQYFILCTRRPLAEIEEMKKSMASSKLSARDAKAELAFELVKIYHGEKAALLAAQEFDQVHRNKELPNDIKEIKLSGQQLVAALVISKLAKSTSAAKRLIDQNGVKIDGLVIKEYNKIIEKGSVLQVGKRNFIKSK